MYQNKPFAVNGETVGHYRDREIPDGRGPVDPGQIDIPGILKNFFL